MQRTVSPMTAMSPSPGDSNLQVSGAANMMSPTTDTYLAPLSSGLGVPSHPLRGFNDPRSSSTHSLVPSMEDTVAGQKRRLLVVYIHGFMGNDSSFRSFPAHVHSFLKETLAETHVVHTKIYPRYKTYKSIDVARDNFSAWLAPHENPTTDVILVGHSMGGLLAAEVVLLPSQNPNAASSPFRHRILGTISLDAPLLGLHPGIVVSGIASLFRPAVSPPAAENGQIEAAVPGQTQSPLLTPSTPAEFPPPPSAHSPSLNLSPSISTMSSSAPDPYYNPSFFNDITFQDRGWIKNIAHFVRKHRDENLFYATAHHLLSHLEFGGCLADYPALRARYERLRRLEDVDEIYQAGIGPRLVRVRFANYYTVSTGAVRKPRPSSPNAFLDRTDAQRESVRRSLDIDSRLSTPRISIEDHSDGSPRHSLQVLEPLPEAVEAPLIEQPSKESIPTATSSEEPLPGSTPTDQDLRLPTIPDPPTPPEPPDLDAYPDKELRKQAEKKFKNDQKAYTQAVKVREKAIKTRQKALDKQHRKALKDAARQEKAEPRKLHKSPSEEQSEPQYPQPEQETEERESKSKKGRLRKFCTIPKGRDPTWIEVYMEGVDEVGAHCGLFMPNAPHYERLVGDVGDRIALWVWEDASRRAIMEGL